MPWVLSPGFMRHFRGVPSGLVTSVTTLPPKPATQATKLAKSKMPRPHLTHPCLDVPLPREVEAATINRAYFAIVSLERS